MLVNGKKGLTSRKIPSLGAPLFEHGACCIIVDLNGNKKSI